MTVPTWTAKMEISVHLKAGNAAARCYDVHDSNNDCDANDGRSD